MSRTRVWLISKVTLTSANNAFRINETGVGGNGVITVTVTPGDYWLHYDTSANAEFPSLYKAVLDALAASIAANGYEIEQNTPTTSPLAYGAGLLIGINATIAWQIEAGNAGFTMDPGWFGLTAATHVATLRTGSVYSIDSDVCIDGVWRSVNATGDGIPNAARSRPTRLSTWSHDDPDNRFGLVWKRRRQRNYRWEYVPAAAVFSHQDLDAYYRLADKGVGDDNGTFEVIWGKLAENESVIAVHECDIWDLQIDSHASELIRLTSIRDAHDLGAIARTSGVNGEYYTIEFDATILTSGLPGYDL